MRLSRKPFHAMLFIMLCGVFSPCGVFAQSDFQWTLSDVGLSTWAINASTDVSSASLYSGPFPGFNPTINLEVGKRYQVTIVNPSFHPFQILAKGPDFTSDLILLSYGDVPTEGNFESDPDVKWMDDGAVTNAKLTFTLTPKLFNAMKSNAGGVQRNPGYRCAVHAPSMRGDFQVTAQTFASAKIWTMY